MDYQTAVSETWRPSKLGPSHSFYRELVRHATLAPSSHNTQPWKFQIATNSITIQPDLTRRCPQVDPDNHHLYVSLGCAAENLILAAQAAGLEAVLNSDSDFQIELKPASPQRSPLFDAIPRRQCSRNEYDGRPISLSDIQLLEEAAKAEGVSMLLLTDRSKLDKVADFVSQGNQTQIGNRIWMQELEHWIRFNESEALSTRDGLYSITTGNPEVPRLMGKMFLKWAFTPASQTKTDVKNIRSSPAIAVFTSEKNDRPSWFAVGRSYERFALQATALDIRTAFINQPSEVQSIRPQFASWLGIGRRRPDLIVRFGRGPEMPRSLRRPVADVLI